MASDDAVITEDASNAPAAEGSNGEDESSTARAAPEIRRIERTAVAKICSGQVVVDLATAVKELVENALDAGATQVEIKLKEWGVEQIEVSDNGSGVAPKDYQGLTLKYHTSKISGFGDLWSVKSFGFRGEALSSLCEISGKFEVVTRTQEDNRGTRLSYDRAGKLTGQEPVARQHGTTVTITNLFEPLPVRRAELRRTVAKQSAKLLRVLQGYALVCTGVRITCSNYKGPKGTRQLLLSTQGSQTMRENIVNVFGASFASTLQPVDMTIEEEGTTEGEKRVTGLVSKIGAGVGRSDNDRQFFFLNRRPVDLPRVTRVVNEVWRQYEMKHKPAVIFNLDAPPGSFDVNVTPDKREVLLVGEAALLEQLKERLHGVWQPANSQCTFDVCQVMDKKQQEEQQRIAAAVVGKRKRSMNEDEEKEEEEEVEEEEEDADSEGAPKEAVAPRREEGEEEHVDLTTRTERRPPSEAEDGIVPMDMVEHEAPDTAAGHEESDKGVEEEEEEEDVGADFAEEEEMALDLPTITSTTGAVTTATRGKASPPERHSSNDGDEDVVDQEEGDMEVEEPSRPPRPPAPRPSVASSLARFRADAESGSGRTGFNKASSTAGGGGAASKGHEWWRNKKGGGGGSSHRLNPSAGSVTRFLTSSTAATAKPPAWMSPAAGGASSSRRAGQRLMEELEEEEEEEEEEEVEEGDEEAGAGEAQVTGMEEEPEDVVVVEERSEKASCACAGDEEVEVVGEVQPGSARKTAGKGRAAALRGEEEEEEDEGTTPQKMSRVARGGSSGPSSSPFLAASPKTRGEAEDQLGSLRKQTAAGGTTRFLFDPQAALRRCANKEQVEKQKPWSSSATGLSASLSAECTTDPERGKDVEEAARVFSRVLTKDHFKQMVVVGQFNLGFIIVRVGSDMFILDQHACDEKYNFETLQATTTIHEQKLICPLPVEVSAMEEVVILDNLAVFKQNGFQFKIDEDAPPMKRLQVTAIPYSKGVQFGVEDIHELASQLSEAPGQMMRLPKIRSMFASRACRMSIMIGKALSRGQMVKVVRNLAKIEQPWNCPHGRPTMRHLVDLDRLDDDK